MTTKNLIEPLKVGTVVKIRNSGYYRAWVAEDRGLLGPKGARVYRVLVLKKPRMYIEFWRTSLRCWTAHKVCLPRGHDREPLLRG